MLVLACDHGGVAVDDVHDVGLVVVQLDRTGSAAAAGVKFVAGRLEQQTTGLELFMNLLLRDVGRRAGHSPSAMPGPGSPAAYRSLSVPHRPPQPVWKNTASPGLTPRPAPASAASASATVTTSPCSRCSLPRAPATSTSRPRVTTCGRVSMPSRFVPWSSTISPRANPL